MEWNVNSISQPEGNQTWKRIKRHGIQNGCIKPFKWKKLNPFEIISISAWHHPHTTAQPGIVYGFEWIVLFKFKRFNSFFSQPFKSSILRLTRVDVELWLKVCSLSMWLTLCGCGWGVRWNGHWNENAGVNRVCVWIIMKQLWHFN